MYGVVVRGVKLINVWDKRGDTVPVLDKRVLLYEVEMGEVLLYDVRMRGASV